MLVGCAPDSDESLALCRQEATEVIELAAANYGQRKNRHIEHCMRAFGYVWDQSRDDCGTYERFRSGKPLAENAALEGCFRSAFDDRSRLAERLSEWLN